MINYALPLEPGSAIGISLAPPIGTVTLRLLRRWDDAFTGYDDPDAILIVAGDKVSAAIDWHGVMDGVDHFYQAYYFDGTTWTGSNIVSAKPSDGMEEMPGDILDLIRERVEFGLNAFVTKNILSHPNGVYTVYTAPPLLDDTVFPVVSVQLSSDSSDEWGVGDYFGSTRFAATVQEYNGYRSRVTVNVVAWSLNPDERRHLRKILKTILLYNLPILDYAGAQNIDISFQDSEDYQSYNAPVFITSGQVSCLAPSVVVTTGTPIMSVVVADPVIGPPYSGPIP